MDMNILGQEIVKQKFEN